MKLTKRSFNKTLLSLVPATMIPNLWSTQRKATALPNLSGPLTGGSHDWPFASQVVDVAQYGYLMEEYILEGVAHAYQVSPGGSTPRNGHWETVAGENARYVTRAYVVRPKSTKDFNGIAVVNWQNVTAGFDIGAPLSAEFFRGYAWIGVTTQKVAVDGNPQDSRAVSETIVTYPGLRDWDPKRYGALSHPGDAWSYDIFTQAGRLIKSGDQQLMGGLKPNILIAAGGSQSAMRLGSYVNAAHRHARVFDGFYLTVHWGICPPINELPLMDLFTPKGRELSPAMCQIRDDLNVPILVLATECEARYNYPVRQPDTNSFRFWEVAGGSHQSPERSRALANIMQRDGVTLGKDPADRNAVNWGYIGSAAIRSMVSWIRDNRPPSSIPRISMTNDPNSPIERDRFGNAKGGIRVPELEAPIASYRGERGDNLATQNWLSGETKALSPSQLAELYPGFDSRIRRWNKAVDDLVKKGLVLSEDETGLRLHGKKNDPFA